MNNNWQCFFKTFNLLGIIELVQLNAVSSEIHAFLICYVVLSEVTKFCIIPGHQKYIELLQFCHHRRVRSFSTHFICSDIKQFYYLSLFIQYYFYLFLHKTWIFCCIDLALEELWLFFVIQSHLYTNLRFSVHPFYNPWRIQGTRSLFCF